ncbi:nuclease [Aliidiomarina minuta]|uniref:Nuclease n=1 Tax=Aliidiomarina minuta TaxID=880057 RepID=A0A432W672_9GAMM|nr:ExeM/NucH family extracellular endonuclease [Aliidiomarina minuta]RUO25479.1 nuclease [Aliidiomarina minuta]
MKIFLAVLMLLTAAPVWAQQPIAYWAQNDNQLADGSAGFEPASFPQYADLGYGELYVQDFNDELDADGAYRWLQSFAGSTANAVSGFPAGGSLSIQGATNNTNNGVSVVLRVDTREYQDIQVSWAQRGTGTGFDSRQFSWSTDGASYNLVDVDEGSLGSSWQVQSYDLSSVSAINDNPVVYFRITLDGASSANGNNRLDNIRVQGVRIADASRVGVYDNDFPSNPFYRGWSQFVVSGESSWEWDESFNNISYTPFLDGNCQPGESWLVSPGFDLDSQQDERVAFEIARGFAGDNDLEVLYSTDYQGGDVSSASWSLLSVITSADFDNNNVPQRFDGFEQLQNEQGHAHIAFRFVYSSGECGTWRLNKLQLTAELAESDPVDFACGAPTTPVHRVQGSNFQSPMQGAEVQLEAIVTTAFLATDESQIGGFYMQAADHEHDSDPYTSEGIFVDASGQYLSLNEGDRVRVQGEVEESFEQTQISNLSDFEVCTTGQSDQVTALPLELPISDFLQFEAVEGMLVELPQELTVTDVFNAVRFAEIQVSKGPLFIPTQVATPGPEAQAVKRANQHNRLVLDDGRTGSNRTPFLIGEDGVSPLSAHNPIRNGYRIEQGHQGVMGYSFAEYRVRSQQLPDYLSQANPRTAQPGIASGGNLRVASYNLENLFATLGDSGETCGPNQLSCRGAADEEELQRQLQKIVSAIIALDAQVVALAEVENDADDATLQMLVDALNQADRLGRWDYIATGWLGTDAIKPGFIYQSLRARPIGDYAVLDSSVDPDFDTSRQRPALAQSFRANNSGRFTAVALHLRAKASCPDSGPDSDQGDGQGCWNDWRTRSTGALARWLEEDPTGNGVAAVLLLGDFNAYAQEDPMRLLESEGYSNLAIAANNGNPEVYSYTFFGESGSLDHGLANPVLAEQVVDAGYWPINADELPVFNYNTGTLPGGFLEKPDNFYSTQPFRSSDHDPMVIELNLRRCTPGLRNLPRHSLGKELNSPEC